MYRLASLMRGSPAIKTIRGPKKKKEAQAKIQSNDIINIYKDRSDPQLLTIQKYPIYVQQFSLGKKSIHELTTGVTLDIGYLAPNQSLYKSYLTAIKRTKCKYDHQMHHLYRKTNIHDEKKDLNSKLAIYNFFAKSKEQEEEEQKKRLEQLAQQEQDSDQ